jgi:Mor family transcriptional regulator
LLHRLEDRAKEMTEQNYPEALTFLKSKIVKVLKEQGIAEEIASSCAHYVAEEVRQEWGGEAIYIGKGQDYELSQRDQEIYAKFNGTNQHALCKEYNISYVWLCKIIKHQRKAMIKKQQVDIFPVPDVPARRKA